jgi:GT2 family glycosyltransferase
VKVAVIIPMFNNNKMTEECIQHCKRNAGIEHEILVVDDGSVEPFDSVDSKTIRLTTNGGFTRAVNSGLRALKLDYDYVCILNNDTIPQENFLKILVDDMEEDKSIGIASSALLQNREDGEFVMHVEGCDLMTGEIFVFKEKDHIEKRMAVFIPFTCVVFSRKLVEYIGLLDERMKNHCSDNDYCVRAVMHDFGVMCDTASRVVHYQSVTVKQLGLGPDADQKVFIAKHFGPMMNEILSILPVNKQMNRWGRIGFRYETPEPEKSLIEVARS